MFNRLIALPFAIAAAATFVGAAAAPANAAEVSCKATPAQIRTLAATKGGEEAGKAIKLVATGEKLCEADAKFEAGKKFAAAAKLLGTELAALPTAVAGQ
ncbi:hypothetical protein CAP39_12095 [Sphingomonas sp. IBVSS1]|uniref:Uncharacterized protein n=1 Tax=Sandarakinorhabdus cyanobacteriorum TaxID=1981098 RepID=A0A255YJG7_9SPHN|nr:hypothetical protein [Sandarakinorhabdus cyanobacteriorum]OSZ67166.1 hypothetical protein CAP39_12095 [Sphingomonas sp. IBVSS1]OYQ28814.1 hypothetical protein CHU93_08265 [Sandarakinorhabdus cyanobacteriorum]